MSSDNKTAKIVLGVTGAIIGLAVLGTFVTALATSVSYKRKHAKTKNALQSLAGASLQTQPQVPIAKTPNVLRSGTRVSESLHLVPRDTEKRIDYWNDKWHFGELNKGSLEFDVKKESGVVVSFADAPNYPKNGYALILDERNQSDRMSMTYLSRLPAMDAAINANSAIRNAELANVTRHIKMTYDHGFIEVFMDGVKLLAYNDPMPPTQIAYVGFGDCGMLSGAGELSNIVIH